MFVRTVSSYSFLSGDINEFFNMFFWQDSALLTPYSLLSPNVLFVIQLSFYIYYFFNFCRFCFVIVAKGSKKGLSVIVVRCLFFVFTHVYFLVCLIFYKYTLY